MAQWLENIAFLTDKAGRWSLAPAFDVTYSYNPTGRWTATHQMTMNGKRDGFTLADFLPLTKRAGLLYQMLTFVSAQSITAGPVE